VPIRLLTPADAAEYWALRLRALKDHPDAFLTSHEDALPTPLEEVAGRLDKPNSFMVGAFEGGKLVGMAGGLREDRAKTRHKAWIIAVYVAPEARGRGVGKEVVEAAMARARQW